MEGTLLTSTSYIQRLRASGGFAPATGCDASNYGATAFVPYETEYFFYRSETRK